MRGELHGKEKETAQRNMALQNIKLLNEQGNLKEGIAKNVEESIQKIRNMKVELHNQDERILIVDKKVEEMDIKLDGTKEVFDGADKRSFCRKIILWLGIVILTIFNSFMLFFTFAKKVGWQQFRKNELNQISNILKEPPSNEAKKIIGINYDFSQDLYLNEFENKKLSFILLKVEKDAPIKEKIVTYIDKAKEKNVKVSLYWYIKQNEEKYVLEEVNKAVNFLKELKEKEKELNLGFYYKFEQNNLQTNYNIINTLCENIEYDSGIYLTYSNFKANYKNNLDSIKKIKNYWINPEGQSIDDSVKKLITMWNTPATVSIKDISYNIIKSLE